LPGKQSGLGATGRRLLVLSALAVAFTSVSMVIACVPASGAEGTRVSSAELIEHSERYDGKTVVYSGEIVGDILWRGEYAWITVNDDDYGERPRRRYQELRGGNNGIGIYCRSDMLDSVRFLGSYGTHGDRLQIEGVFRQASTQHGGDTMIEAARVTVVRSGYHIDDNHFGKEPFIILGLLPVSLILGYIWWRKERG
jgi:hypothetical protein